MSFAPAVDVVPAMTMVFVLLSDGVTIPGHTDRGVSCVMVLSSVQLAQGYGTEM